MSSAAGPSIATSGLVLDIDMANTQKSWLGKPTTNLVITKVENYTGWGGAGWWMHPGNTTSVTSQTLPDGNTGLTLTATTLSSGGLYGYNGYALGAAYVNGTQYTASFWVKSYNGTASLNVRDSDAGGTLSTGVSGITDTWQRFSFTWTANASTNMLTFTGSNFSLYNVQLETNSFATPFVFGTRSASQALVDLTNNNTLTATSLTYASDNTFSFNGTTDRILITNAAFNRTTAQEMTVSCWIKPSRLGGQYNAFINCRTDSGYNWMLYMHATDGALSFHGSAQNKTTVIPAINTWVHVAQTVTSAGVSTLYVNGVSAAVITGYTYNLASPGQIGIGAWGTYTGESFQGSISQACVYNRALSAAEVAQNFNATAGRYRSTIGSHPSYPAPSGYYLAQNYPTFGSGYYWIQSSSMPNPLLMYVDMSEEGGGYDFYAIAGTGISVNYTNITNSGTALGLDLVYPRSKYHWRAMSNYVKNVLGLTGAGYSNYFQTTYGVRSASAGGNYTNVIMRNPTNYGTGSSAHSVADGGRWWLRDTIFTEPNGDYPAYGTFGGYAFPEPYALTDMQFNDISASYPTGAYYLVSTNAKP